MTGFPRQRRLRPLDDADVVALLYGAAPYERPDLEGAADLVTALRSLSEDVPPPSPALAALLRDGLSPGAASAPAPVDVPVVAARPASRRVLVRLAGVSLAAKVLVGTGVAFAGVAAAAGGGVLPQVVNDRFTRIVDLVTPDPAPVPAEVPPLAPAPLGEDARPADGESGDRSADPDVPRRTVPVPERAPAPVGPSQDGQRPDDRPTGPARRGADDTGERDDARDADRDSEGSEGDRRGRLTDDSESEERREREPSGDDRTSGDRTSEDRTDDDAEASEDDSTEDGPAEDRPVGDRADDDEAVQPTDRVRDDVGETPVDGTEGDARSTVSVRR